MARLFVAVWPPPDVVAAVAELPRPEEPGVRWEPPQRWHVTLRFLGNAEPDDAATALGRLEPPPAPVVARVGPAVSRLGRRVLCLPVAGLDELAEAVRAATAEVGEPPDPRPFAGHLTLARLGSRGACRLAGHRFARSFPVTELTLVASRTTREGPVYEVVRRWEISPGVDGDP